MAVGHALKRGLVALREAQRQESLREIKRRTLRRTQEMMNLQPTSEQWREVQQCSWGRPGDISEIPLDSKAVVSPTETLSALYARRMRRQGHNYRIQDDSVQCAPFQR